MVASVSPLYNEFDDSGQAWTGLCETYQATAYHCRGDFLDTLPILPIGLRPAGDRTVYQIFLQKFDITTIRHAIVPITMDYLANVEVWVSISSLERVAGVGDNVEIIFQGITLARICKEIHDADKLDMVEPLFSCHPTQSLTIMPSLLVRYAKEVCSALSALLITSFKRRVQMSLTIVDKSIGGDGQLCAVLIHLADALT